MSILIVTITYNSSNKITNFLNSLKQFIKEGNNIIIVENGSKDYLLTKRKIDEWLLINNSLVEHVTYRLRDNKGFASSCNYGVLEVNNNYSHYLFLNPDTTLSSRNSLNTLLKHAIDNKAAICGMKMLGNNSKIQKSVFNIPDLKCILFEFTNLKKIFNTKIGEQSFYKEIDLIHEDTIVDGVSGGAMLVKSNVFKKLNGFDERFFMYLEDVDLCLRAKRQGYKTFYCPHSMIYHEGGASSNNKDRIRHSAWFESRRKYLYKHFNVITNLFIQPMMLLEEIILLIIRIFRGLRAR